MLEADDKSGTDAEVNSTDMLEAEFLTELEEEDAAEAPAPTQPADDVEPDDELQDDVEESDEEDGEDGDPDTDHAREPLPIGMSETDREWFSQLPAAAKARLVSRERERQSYLTQQSQQTAETKRQADMAFQAYQQRIAEYDRHLATFSQPPKPPSRDLLSTDPDAFMEQLADYHEGQAFAERATAERQRLQQEQHQLTAHRLHSYQAEQAQLLRQQAPDLVSDPEAMRGLVAHARQMGFDDNAMAQASAAEWQVLNKARLYDQMQSASQKLKTKPTTTTERKAPPKAAKPGPAKGRGSRRVRAMDNLRAAPSASTLEAAFLAELDAE